MEEERDATRASGLNDLAREAIFTGMCSEVWENQVKSPGTQSRFSIDLDNGE